MTPALSPDSPLAGLDPAHLPRHLAIIMDGNGRWAKARGWLRLKGHEEGAESVRVVVRACRELGIPVLTLYAFSEENWGRPQDEVGGLMRLLTRFLTTQRPEMVDKGVRLLALGDTGKLPPATREALAATLAATAHCRDLTLCLALSYGGRQEIVRAARLLAEDAAAAYEGDPSSRSPGEAIFCFPSLLALTHYRVAHELHVLGVDLVPRILTEMAHAKTGIDIHPGAVIGRRFFIDHGTGTVIGETCVIGDNVRLYQGVTLGAKSFPKDGEGKLVKGIPRHPVVEDDVVVYSGATVLGRITVGRGAVIGGNVWVTRDVPPGANIAQHRPVGVPLIDGGGI